MITEQIIGWVNQNISDDRRWKLISVNPQHWKPNYFLKKGFIYMYT